MFELRRRRRRPKRRIWVGPFHGAKISYPTPLEMLVLSEERDAQLRTHTGPRSRGSKGGKGGRELRHTEMVTSKGAGETKRGRLNRPRILEILVEDEGEGSTSFSLPPFFLIFFPSFRPGLFFPRFIPWDGKREVVEGRRGRET